MEDTADTLFPPAADTFDQSTNRLGRDSDELTRAKQAVQALRDAGFLSTDIRPLSSPEALKRLEAKDE